MCVYSIVSHLYYTARTALRMHSGIVLCGVVTASLVDRVAIVPNQTKDGAIISAAPQGGTLQAPAHMLRFLMAYAL